MPCPLPSFHCPWFLVYGSIKDFRLYLVPYLPSTAHDSLYMAQSMTLGCALCLIWPPPPSLSLIFHPLPMIPCFWLNQRLKVVPCPSPHPTHRSLLLAQWLWVVPCPLPSSHCPSSLFMAQSVTFACALSLTFLPLPTLPCLCLN